MAMFSSRKTPQSECRYSDSDLKNGYTCDECLAEQRICVKSVWIKGQWELTVFSLPGKLCEGVTFEDRLYWVTE